MDPNYQTPNGQQQNYQTPDGQQPNYKENPLAVMQPGEQVICEIKRHPFGLFGLYFSVAVMIVVLIAAAVAAPHFDTNLSSQGKSVIFVMVLIIAAIVALFTYVSTIIYKANRWIVTSDSITQVSQVGLFSKQTSQLSLANLEDVTVEQHGPIQSMLNFGNLRAETAGEKSKFFFIYCPNPNYYAREILACHERFMQRDNEEPRHTDEALAMPQQPQQPQQPPQMPPQTPGGY